jgi:hypothetical protein
MTTKEELFGEPFENSPYVKLTESEVDELLRFASKLESVRVANRDTFKCARKDVAGFGGEFAFSKYYDLPYSYELKEGGDAYDFTVRHSPSGNSGTIDVKTITFGGGDLLIQASRQLTSDCYFLVEKRGSAFGLIGYVSRSEAAEATIHPGGDYSPVAVRRIPREALHKPPEPDEIRSYKPRVRLGS